MVVNLLPSDPRSLRAACAAAVLFAGGALLGGCDDEATGCGDVARCDGGAVDGGGVDASAGDAGSTADAGAADAGGGSDGGARTDAGPADGGGEDGGASVDGGAPDGGAEDGGGPDGDAGATACADDDDCVGDTWCRPTESGGSVCVPYRVDGESCGGFVPPHLRERCRPDLGCVQPNPLLADAPGVCALAATVAELDAAPSTYDLRWVAVLDGWIRMGAVGCGSGGCGDGCCDLCVSDLYLHDAATGSGPRLALATPAGIGYDCRGDECALESTCDEAPDDRYRIIGPFEESPTPSREHRVRVEHLTDVTP